MLPSNPPLPEDGNLLVVQATIITSVGRSIIASAGALITSGRGGRTYEQVLDETLRVGVPNGRFREGRGDVFNNGRRHIAVGGRSVVPAVRPAVPPPQVISRPSDASGGLLTSEQPRGPTYMSLISDVLGAATSYYDYRSARDFMPPVQAQPALFGQDQFGVDGGSLRVGAPDACGSGCDAPRYLTYDCKTGEYKKRRRRRRRGLTKGQMQDLQFVSTLPNTQNVKSYLSTMGR